MELYVFFHYKFNERDFEWFYYYIIIEKSDKIMIGFLMKVKNNILELENQQRERY